MHDISIKVINMRTRNESIFFQKFSQVFLQTDLKLVLYSRGKNMDEMNHKITWLEKRPQD